MSLPPGAISPSLSDAGAGLAYSPTLPSPTLGTTELCPPAGIGFLQVPSDVCYHQAGDLKSFKYFVQC